MLLLNLLFPNKNANNMKTFTKVEDQGAQSSAFPTSYALFWIRSTIGNT